MAYPYEFYVKWTYGNIASWFDSYKLCFFIKVVFLKLFLDKPQGEGSSIDWHFYIPQHKRQRSCVVLMAVSYDKCLYLFLIFLEVGYVGDGNINPPPIILWEHEAAVYDNYGIVIFHSHHIEPNLAETTKGDNAQGILSGNIIHIRVNHTTTTSKRQKLLILCAPKLHDIKLLNEITIWWS